MLTTIYNHRAPTETTLHQNTKRTHTELANQLGLPLAVVALVREVLDNTSAQSQRALAECDNDVTAAAVWLAEYRQRYRVAEQVTPDAVARIIEMDGRGS